MKIMSNGYPPDSSPTKELQLEIGKAMSSLQNAADYARRANRKFMVIHANSARTWLTDARKWAEWKRLEGMPDAEILLKRIAEVDAVAAACEDTTLPFDSYAANIEQASARLSDAMRNVHD